jgi:hypothetical protein
MSKKDNKAEWEAVLESLTNESKKRNSEPFKFSNSLYGGILGLGILSLISGFLLMCLNHYASRAWDFVPDTAGYWDCYFVMLFVLTLYMLKLSIQQSFNSNKEPN